MLRFKNFVLSTLGWSLIWLMLSYAGSIHHELAVRLMPTQHTLEVTDKITIPAEKLKLLPPEISFLLHGNLQVQALTPAVTLTSMPVKEAPLFTQFSNTLSLPEDLPLQCYQFARPTDITRDFTFILQYRGVIYHPIEQKSEEYARSFSETPGIISGEGVVLSGSSGWVPWFGPELVHFNLDVELPESWDAISQGKRTQALFENQSRKVRWESPEIMDEIYLIAGKFTEYTRAVGPVTAMACLRTADENLAKKYLETTAQYLQMYQQLIGPYPYAKFALIENFWETGYGMPSFTLLGPKIIRFPFILHSSYPHEILHNWWGNSVFVDYEQGNWCEGLTAYLADHLIKEQQGEGVTYRRDALQNYKDYVKTSRDFPLSEFRARHDAPSAAIGYNKSMMFFHALRLKFGDEKFTKAIQTFYQYNKFKRVTFKEIQQAFEDVTGEKLDGLFEQWVPRAGAPELQLSRVQVKPQAGQYRLTFQLRQIQAGPVYRLEIPVVVTFEAEASPVRQVLELNAKSQDYAWLFKLKPVWIEVDPQFDVFRRLAREEIPPALSQVFGAEKVTIILPSRAPDSLYQAYQKIAQQWEKAPQIQWVRDSDLTELPKTGAVWLLGQENRWIEQAQASWRNYPVQFKSDSMWLDQQILPVRETSWIVTGRNPQNPDYTMAWLVTTHPAAAAGLARKLPHYGKYSYLVFKGAEPENIAKGQWGASDSPLSRCLAPAQQKRLRPASLRGTEPLAKLTPLFSAKAFGEHLSYLASDRLQGRGLGTPELDQAAAYLAEQFQRAGLQPFQNDGSYFQIWTDSVGAPRRLAQLTNVIGILPGRRSDWQDQCVVLCAHYDHLGLGWPTGRPENQGQIHNGADDNASGVAVLLELAKMLASSFKPARSLVFIAFTGEEAGRLGSRYYLQANARFPAQKVMAALNLDTVGRLESKNLLILGGQSAREWVHILRGVGFVTSIKYDLVTEKLDASDDESFREHQIPAVQFFSGPHWDYHQPTDDLEKIDLSGLETVATFVKEVMVYLVEREEPLTAPSAMISAAAPAEKSPAGANRRVTLGTMPDFGYAGEGVRIGAITPDSPAAKAGLQVNDILKKIDHYPITKLADLAEILKRYTPGAQIKMQFERAGSLQETEVTLISR
ncbi:M20/M25/M40 family metallo-hydrolase [candidate division KSB1 bacterium]|nr:M20/M25/M40 family metallo-hydrolase [candidate division KSB1 bacterium]